MSEAKAVKEKTEATVSADKAPVQMFDVQTLRGSCLKLFGVTTSTFDGAMHGQKGPFSIAEAKSIIEGWKKGEAN